MVSELLIVAAAFLLSAWVIVPDFEIFLLYEDGLAQLGVVIASVVLGLYFQDLYANIRVRSRILLLQQLALVIGLVFLMQAVLTYVNPEIMMPRAVMVSGAALLLMLVPAWRILFTRKIYPSFGTEHVVFLGANQTVQEITSRLRERPEIGISPLGFLHDNAPAGAIAGVPCLGGIGDLRAVVAAQQPNRIVVGMSERRDVLPLQDLLDLRFSGIRVQDASELFEATFGRIPVRHLLPSQLIFSSELGPRSRVLVIQRLYSLLLALLGVIVAAPVMLIVAVAVRVSSSGPILYRQVRVGQNGIPFTLFKFRSMRADAEAGTGAVWAQREDPRVTGVGRLLRKTRLDEIPQLWNVVKGEMSIVGPRPERPEFVQTLSEQIPFYRQRHCVKPGITGWAQINHKYGDTLEDTVIKLEYDLYYIKHLSPTLDGYIMFHTLKVMLFSGHGQ